MILNAIPGIGPVMLNRLLDHFAQDPWEIIHANPSKLTQIKGIGKKLIQSITETNWIEWLSRETEKLGKMNGCFIHNEEIPSYLSELEDPPAGLYCLGEIPPLPCISIVGTRIPSSYGKKYARELARDLASAGVCVVSGMARGIDTEAHLGALEAGGKTLAFLGSGLDVIYPPENLGLYQKIISSGAVLSEFPLGKKADRRTFPMRNRLVAGVSLGVVVIESAKAGGSMITARFAAEQGRTVFALPGRIDHAESAGCLSLIRDGATLVRNCKDILSEIAPMMNHFSPIDLRSENEELLSNHKLDPTQQKIIEVLQGDILDLEQIQQLTELPLNEVMATTTMLEIQGLIHKRPDTRFELR